MRSFSRARWLTLPAALALTHCTFAPLDLTGRRCPCYEAAGYRCVANVCVLDPTFDAGDIAAPLDAEDTTSPLDGPEASMPDASMPDASVPDGPTPDAADVPGIPCPTGDGRFGRPLLTHTLRPSATGEIYHTDIQASFPAVDWANLDRLYIEAGDYSVISLFNLPMRSAARPLVITNRGGRVVTPRLSLRGGGGWVLTGRYDPESETGDVRYPGHRGGRFANTQGTYGILVQRTAMTNAIVTVEPPATDIELEYLEVTGGTYTSVQFRTNVGAAIRGARLHDSYVHDGDGHAFWATPFVDGSEGFERLRVDHNRFARLGVGAMVLRNVLDGSEVDHNAIVAPSMDWRNAGGSLYAIEVSALRAFEQHDNVLSGAGSGFLNLVLDGPGTTITFARVHDEFYSGSLSLIGRVRAVDTGRLGLRLDFNRFALVGWGLADLYPPPAVPPDPSFAVEAATTPLTIANNQWETVPTMRQLFTPQSNISASGNTHTTLGTVGFVDAFPGDDAPYGAGHQELWSPTQTRITTNPTRTYRMGDRVAWAGHLYECIAATSNSQQPDTSSAAWRDLGVPPDDLRIAPTACNVGRPE